MRYLLISDIHGNLDALEAVLEDARELYDQIVCCGDIVGYGPEPNRVVEWARRNLAVVIRGNHDRACCGMEDLEWFNPVAQTATRWTIADLSSENTAWLRQLPSGPVVVDGFTIAHGSPLDEDEYIASLADADNVFDYLDSAVTFIGHTHLQGGFVWSAEGRQVIERPHSYVRQVEIVLNEEAIYLINPGSVGQPRDGDPRAGYALVDSIARTVALRRVAYDYDRVRRKIDEAGLPPSLGTRLVYGR